MSEYSDMLDEIFREGQIQLELNKESGENFQRLIEQSILNLSALKAIEEKEIDLDKLGN